MVENKIKAIIVEQLKVDLEELSGTTDFKKDLGVDSLDLFELAMAFEEAFEIEIPSEDLEGIGTIQDAVRYIEGKQQ